MGCPQAYITPNPAVVRLRLLYSDLLLNSSFMQNGFFLGVLNQIQSRRFTLRKSSLGPPSLKNTLIDVDANIVLK